MTHVAQRTQKRSSIQSVPGELERCGRTSPRGPASPRASLPATRSRPAALQCLQHAGGRSRRASTTTPLPASFRRTRRPARSSSTPNSAPQPASRSRPRPDGSASCPRFQERMERARRRSQQQRLPLDVARDPAIVFLQRCRSAPWREFADRPSQRGLIPGSAQRPGRRGRPEQPQWSAPARPRPSDTASRNSRAADATVIDAARTTSWSARWAIRPRTHRISAHFRLDGDRRDARCARRARRPAARGPEESGGDPLGQDAHVIPLRGVVAQRSSSTSRRRR